METPLQKFYTFLDENQDEIRYARRGYIMRLSNLFKEKTGIDLSYPQVRRWLSTYRVERHFKLQYCPHTYYRPVAHRKNPNILNPYAPQPHTIQLAI